MTKVVLYSRYWQPITAVDVPPFATMPDVITWGFRAFVLQINGKYREGHVWSVLPPMETTGPTPRF